MQMVLDILNLHVPDCEVWVFGSRVLGTARPYSDLDIVLRCVSKVPNEVLAALRDAFAASTLPMRVDVLDWGRISTSFKKIVEGQKILLRPASFG